MPIQQVSLQNNSITAQKQQNNVAVSHVTTKSIGDTVEISSKKKENKVLKYTLIGIGALLGAVAIAKYKSIAKLFRKTPDVGSEVKTTPKENPKIPSPLVPLSEIKQSEGKPFIENSSEGYKAWHFVSDDFLKTFVEAHPDLLEIFKNKISFNLNFIKEDAKEGKAEAINFINAVKEKTGVDLLNDEIKHYRYIGQSELDVIKANQPVIGKGGGGNHIYMTPCKYGGSKYNIVPAKSDYRLTFKTTPELIDRIYKDGGYHDTAYKASINGKYTRADVEKVEKLVDGNWQEVEF